MINEAEIRIYKTDEYLGLWKTEYDQVPKVSLRFKPENLEKLKRLDDLAQLIVGVEMIPAKEFKETYLSRTDISINLDLTDTQPNTWAVFRQY